MRKLRGYLKYLLPAFLLVLLVGLFLSRVYRPERRLSEPSVRITPFEARNHIGRAAEVCGVVATADYVPQIGGEPTFLNLGRGYPDQPFTAVIWGDDRPAWSVMPEQYYRNQEICVTGVIGLHEDTPQIIVSDPRQIRVR